MFFILHISASNKDLLVTLHVWIGHISSPVSCGPCALDSATNNVPMSIEATPWNWWCVFIAGMHASWGLLSPFALVIVGMPNIVVSQGMDTQNQKLERRLQGNCQISGSPTSATRSPDSNQQTPMKEPSLTENTVDVPRRETTWGWFYLRNGNTTPLSSRQTAWQPNMLGHKCTCADTCQDNFKHYNYHNRDCCLLPGNDGLQYRLRTLYNSEHNVFVGLFSNQRRPNADTSHTVDEEIATTLNTGLSWKHHSKLLHVMDVEVVFHVQSRVLICTLKAIANPIALNGRLIIVLLFVINIAVAMKILLHVKTTLNPKFLVTLLLRYQTSYYNSTRTNRAPPSAFSKRLHYLRSHTHHYLVTPLVHGSAPTWKRRWKIWRGW